MVCPNCHSDQVIAVQDQHFCINCGQAVPEALVPKSAKTAAAVGVQDNGLPEGVKFLPLTTAPAGLIKPRSRLPQPQAEEEPEVKPKRRKAGRPKSGRLDEPLATTAVEPKPLPSAPAVTPVDADSTPVPKLPAGPRTLSDISPRRHPTHDVKTTPEKSQVSKLKHKPKKKAARQHKPTLPPLHYGSVVAFSLRARVRPRLLALSAAATIGFAAAIGYCVWVLMTSGLTELANNLIKSRTPILIELLLMALIYYIGRSIGQSAITYGVIREADQRPVSLSRQLGVAVNSFFKRLTLDASFGLIELCLLGLIGLLVVVGGSSWPVGSQYQLVALFCSFLLLLYLLTGLALSRGLADVAITLTNQGPIESAVLGWKLFSHRFELLGLRFLAITLELVLAVPLAALAIAFVVSAKPGLYLVVSLGVGLLSWIAGAMLGAGTAAWWASLYRNLVLADHSDRAVSLLAGRSSSETKPVPLAFVVCLSTLLIAAVIALPWLKFF